MGGSGPCVSFRGRDSALASVKKARQPLRGSFAFAVFGLPIGISRWACLDLNQGPPLYQSGALTELSYRPLDTVEPTKACRRVNLQHETVPDKRARGARRNTYALPVQLKALE